MIDTIKREIDNMNRDVGFYQALTDEEDIRFQMNTERNIGLKEGIEKGIKKGIMQGLEQGHEQGIAEGLEQGIAKGLEQGIVEANLNNARKMKLENIPIALINKITGLDTKVIMSL